ncbi:MAG: acetyl-CoA carboxylase biotin carboxyl carrier protein subunit [Bacteroidales bacterium]
MAILKNKKPESPCGKTIKCKYLTIEGTRYRTLLNNKFQNRKKWEAPDPTKILSYIPGTIQEVYVKEGATVKEGDPLVMLEAMKMRNVITSNANGKLIKVNVSKGERVPKGHLLVQLEA